MNWFGIITIFIFICTTGNLRGQSDGVTRNRPDEARSAYSAEMAIDFIERSVSKWQERRRCVTCHTNGLHLVAGAQITPNSQVLISNQKFTRDYLTSYISGKAKPRGQRGAIEGIVAGASFLAISEMTTDKKLHAQTVRALDYIWSKQNPSGAWEDWLKCHWGPFEVDDHFGVTLATIALAMAPIEYRSQPNAMEAEKKLHQYLKANAPTAPHQQAMMLWAARHAPELATVEQQQRWVKSLRKLQQEDGGWVLAQLGDAQWQREDEKPHHQTSDGYATALGLYALRQAGVSKEDPGIVRGIKWLKANQRQSGRWFTHSPRRDGRHYITQAGTNMALLALHSCGALGIDGLITRDIERHASALVPLNPAPEQAGVEPPASSPEAE